MEFGFHPSRGPVSGGFGPAFSADGQKLAILHSGSSPASPAQGSLFPVNVNDRPSQDPVKPFRRFLVGLGMPVGRQRLDETLLYNVLRQMWIAQPTLGKPYEHLEVLQDRIINPRHAGKVTSSPRSW